MHFLCFLYLPLFFYGEKGDCSNFCYISWLLTSIYVLLTPKFLSPTQTLPTQGWLTKLSADMASLWSLHFMDVPQTTNPRQVLICISEHLRIKGIYSCLHPGWWCVMLKPLSVCVWSAIWVYVSVCDLEFYAHSPCVYYPDRQLCVIFPELTSTGLFGLFLLFSWYFESGPPTPQNRQKSTPHIFPEMLGNVL